MAHFAKISEENEVITVLVINNKDVQNEQGEEVESVGKNFCQTTYNWPANLWVQCSYNTKQGVHQLGGTPLRGNYPTTGWIWDSGDQIFLPPKPYTSWVKNISEARWQSPIGDEPAITTEQQTQNDAGTNYWYHEWNDADQQWDLTDALNNI